MTEDAVLLTRQLVELQLKPDYADTLRNIQHWTSGELNRLSGLILEAPHSPCVARHEDIARDPCHPAMPFYPWGPLERSEA